MRVDSIAKLAPRARLIYEDALIMAFTPLKLIIVLGVMGNEVFGAAVAANVKISAMIYFALE